jgi:uncharacterized protein YjbI with pentapeptide repeats
MAKKIKIEIKSWLNDSILFSYETEDNTLLKTVNEANRRGADLSGADLRKADLSGANLSGANLYEANLRGADLSGADLYEANLSGANLSGADLSGADLSGADLSGANLYGADLSGADLRKADLYGADLRGADLSGANLSGANLYGADLNGQTMDRLPQYFINSCSRDILFILEHLKPEVPFLKQKLLEGGVNGSQYSGDCACLVGTLAKADNDDASTSDVEGLCKAIPFYTMGTHNPGEQWFLNIHEGDTPKDNEFAKHAVRLCNMVLGLPEDDGLVSQN